MHPFFILQTHINPPQNSVNVIMRGKDSYKALDCLSWDLHESFNVYFLCDITQYLMMYFYIIPLQYPSPSWSFKKYESSPFSSHLSFYCTSISYPFYLAMCWTLYFLFHTPPLFCICLHWILTISKLCLVIPYLYVDFGGPPTSVCCLISPLLPYPRHLS